MTSISVLTLVGALTLLVVGAIASPHPYQLGTVAGPGTSCSRLLPIILTNVPLDVVQREAAPALGKPYFYSHSISSLRSLGRLPSLSCRAFPPFSVSLSRIARPGCIYPFRRRPTDPIW